jgi:hypothetical protein
MKTLETYAINLRKKLRENGWIYSSAIYRDIAELCDEVETVSAAMWVGSREFF